MPLVDLLKTQFDDAESAFLALALEGLSPDYPVLASSLEHIRAGSPPDSRLSVQLSYFAVAFPATFTSERVDKLRTALIPTE